MLVHQSLKLLRQIKVLEVAIPVAMPGLSRMLTFYNHFFPIVAGYLKTKYMYRGDFILLDSVSRFIRRVIPLLGGDKSKTEVRRTVLYASYFQVSK